jgi:hypothetical protein
MYHVITTLPQCLATMFYVLIVSYSVTMYGSGMCLIDGSARLAEVKLMRRLRTQASELDPIGALCFLGLAGPEAVVHGMHFEIIF